MLFLVVPMYGASHACALFFCDAFWKISSMYLLNFNLQSKVIPSSFSLREYFTKTLEAHITKIKEYFSLMFSPIYSKSVSAFNEISLFKNCEISYELAR